MPMINRDITSLLNVGTGLTTRAESEGNAGSKFRLNGLGSTAMAVTANGTDANGNPGSLVIIGPGTFTLTRGIPMGEMDTPSVGDLDITAATTISGAGSNKTIINENRTVVRRDFDDDHDRFDSRRFRDHDHGSSFSLAVGIGGGYGGSSLALGYNEGYHSRSSFGFGYAAEPAVIGSTVPAGKPMISCDAGTDPGDDHCP